MSLYMVFDNQLYIIETCKAVQEAIKRNFILSKSSFCGQDIKYLNVLGVHPLIAAKGTLRISYHIDTKKTDIDELIIYIADNLAGPAPDQGAVPVEELAEFAQAPTE